MDEPGAGKMSTGGGVPLCRADEIQEGGVRACAAAGKEYLVTRQDGEVHVYQHKCPHLGGPLSRGRVEKGIVTCPWHASQFDLRTGGKLRGPRVGPNIPWVRSLIAMFVRNLRTYRSSVRDGMITLEET